MSAGEKIVERFLDDLQKHKILSASFGGLALASGILACFSPAWIEARGYPEKIKLIPAGAAVVCIVLVSIGAVVGIFVWLRANKATKVERDLKEAGRVERKRKESEDERAKIREVEAEANRRGEIERAVPGLEGELRERIWDQVKLDVVHEAYSVNVGAVVDLIEIGFLVQNPHGVESFTLHPYAKELVKRLICEETEDGTWQQHPRAPWRR